LKIYYESDQSRKNISIKKVNGIPLIDYCCPYMNKFFKKYNNKDFNISLFFTEDDIPEAQLSFVSYILQEKYGVERSSLKIEYCPFCGEKIFLYNPDKKETDY